MKYTHVQRQRRVARAKAKRILPNGWLRVSIRNKQGYHSKDQGFGFETTQLFGNTILLGRRRRR